MHLHEGGVCANATHKSSRSASHAPSLCEQRCWSVVAQSGFGADLDAAAKGDVISIMHLVRLSR